MTSPGAPTPILLGGAIGPPRSFRSDTVGIFAVLMVVGLGNLVTPREGSLDDLVSLPVSLLWDLTLVVFGALGLASCLVPQRYTLTALGVEFAARFALGFGSAAYAVAVVEANGLTGASVVRIATYSGISVLCLTAAWSILRWLLQRRRQVSTLLAEQQQARATSGA